MSSSRQLLDRVHSLAAIAALEADPGGYAGALAAELPAELAARDAAFADALRHVDELAARVMRIRLEYVLAADTAIPPPTRRVFASTITSYEDRLALLAERVRDVAARARAAAPDALAEVVCEAARATLALRAALRAPVLGLVREHATAAVGDADQRARDRRLEDTERKRWSATRRELEAVAAEPTRVLAAPFAARVAAWPEHLDETTTTEPTLAELIELD